jgi:hypothetical protein
MEEAGCSKYDFMQRHFSDNTPTHEQRIQGHITDEVIFEDLPKERFQCPPDEIQLTLVEHYPHLGKYLDPEDVSPDQTIHDPLVHKKLVEGTLKQMELEQKILRIEELIDTAMIRLMELHRPPQEPFVPLEKEFIDI